MGMAAAPAGNEIQPPQLPLDYQQVLGARGPPSKMKGCRNVRGLPLHQRKLFRNLARQTPRVQGLTFDHNQIRWISYWKNEQNKQVQKHFPVSRYGFFDARKLALEERNRVQGWPLDTDEAAAAIERLKVDVVAFQGREDGANPNPEELQHLETDEENLNAHASESLLMRSMREDDEEGYDRHRATGSLTRRRGNRPKAVRRGLNVSTQTDRRESSFYSERERAEGFAMQTDTGQERQQSRTLKEAADYTEFLNRAHELAAAQKAEHSSLDPQRKLQRKAVQALEPWARHFKQDKLTETFLALTPARAVGSLYLDGGTDRQISGSSRLVSMASTTFEEGEPLGDASSSSRDNPHQEPDALRDLLNCVVSEPVDSGVDWEAESAHATSIVDVSRPTRNPTNQQTRNF